VIPGTASQFRIADLLGRRVVAKIDFSGIPKGTIGLVTSTLGDEIAVRWTTRGGYEVDDGFKRDAEFDETEYLDVIQ
jgi:hypothetical protein